MRLYVSPGPDCVVVHRGGLSALLRSRLRREYICAGARRSDVVDVTPNYAWVPAGTFMDDGYRLLGAAVLPGSVGMSDFHVEVDEAGEGDGHPCLYHLPGAIRAKWCRQKGYDPAKDLAVRLGIIGGEIRSEAARRALGEPFGGIQIREQYGTAEVGIIANECEFGGWHAPER